MADLGQRPGLEWRSDKLPQRDNQLGGTWFWIRHNVTRLASGHVCTGEGGGWRFVKDREIVHEQG